jgi:hypothetical protein
VERIEAPWWTAIPFLGDGAYELDIILPEAGDVWLLLQYDGPHDVRLEGATLWRLDLSQ